MALHPSFPSDPHVVLDPAIRWFPADETLREKMGNLMPPLVPELRKQVKKWRESRYAGATETSRSLLDWWFRPPLGARVEFFSQAVRTGIDAGPQFSGHPH